jgi:hypothetical protein
MIREAMRLSLEESREQGVRRHEEDHGQRADEKARVRRSPSPSPSYRGAMADSPYAPMKDPYVGKVKGMSNKQLETERNRLEQNIASIEDLATNGYPISLRMGLDLRIQRNERRVCDEELRSRGLRY